MPQGSGAAKRLWGFGHASGGNKGRERHAQRRFCSAVSVSELVRMNALWAVRGVCECSSLRIERMNASLAAAGGKPARISLVAIVDPQ